MNTRLILSITAGAVLFALASSAQGMSGTSGAASPGGSSFALGERVKDYGRKLGEALKKADRKREASGLQSVMPSRSTEGLDIDEASLIGAKTGVEYFSRLLDLERKDAPDWQPFAKGVKAEWLTGNDAKALDGTSLLWSVASDASEVDGNVPILVTANFDCSKIPAAWDGETDADKVIKLNASPAPLGMGLGLVGMVLVRKNGEVEYLPASKVTLRNLCKGKAMRFSPEYAEYPLSYLAPTRRVAIQKE